MEAAGVINGKRCLVIRAIADYAIHTKISCGRITPQEWLLILRENFFSQFSRRL